MSKFGYTTATLLTTVIAASFAASPAAAASPYCDRSSWMYDKTLCDQIGDRTGSGPTLVPTTTAPSSTSGGGITGFISENAGLLVLIVAGLIAWAIIAGFRSEAADKAKATAAEQQVALDRGRAIAMDHHAAAVQAAPSQELPLPPPMSDADLKRYSTFGAAVDWVPGTAFAAVVARDGSIEPADRAWIEACRAAKLGEFDPETGVFSPAAELTNVRSVADGTGDVILAVQPSTIFIGEKQLDAVAEFLVKTAHVRSAGSFEREHNSGKYTTRLSNTDAIAPAGDQPQGVDIWSW